MFDVIIVGGGPSGMSAALILGRCRRSVLLFDTGTYRNRFAREMHGYLSRDGIAPLDFIKESRSDLRKYGIRIKRKYVENIEKKENRFNVFDKDGKKYSARKVLIATGLTDKLPPIKDIEKFYGKNVHHCPICDGWEQKDKTLIIYGEGKAGYHFALTMHNWSQNLILCTNGPSGFSESRLRTLKKHKIRLIEEKIVKARGSRGCLQELIFEDGSRAGCQAMFFSNGFKQHWHILHRLGCRFTAKKEIWVNRLQESSVKGLYVSGDAAKDMKLVIIAAAEGAKAGVAINSALLAK